MKNKGIASVVGSAVFLFVMVAPLTCLAGRGMAEPLEATSRKGMVVSASAIASRVGATVLEVGGNAVDAAIATAFALAVTHPQAGNLGGGGFMIVQPPRGKAVAIDYREKAPGASTPSLFLDDDGSIDKNLIKTGVLAVGVPGTVRGLELAHNLFGKRPWKELVQPAVHLATAGFLVSEDFAGSMNRVLEGSMSEFPSSVRAYGKPDGSAWESGDRMVLKDLGKTLAAIADEGAGVFYRGWIADKLVGFIRENGGILTANDLRNYQAVIRVPVRGTFGGFEIVAMPPPSSGGVALIEMLNILESSHYQKMGRGSANAIHLLAETMRRAFLDRARHIGDPDFVSVPVKRLVSKAHARSVGADIDRTRSTNSVALAKDLFPKAPPREGDQTTHFSVVDGDGMAVSNTYTLEASWGSKVVVEGAGFLLNNEMGDFNRKPGLTDTKGNIGTAANVIEPGKRMLSSMTPTIVRRNERVVLVTGSPGGRTIINTVVQVVLNVTAFGDRTRGAVDAPRIHHQWLPDRLLIEEGRLPEETVEELRRRGHEVKPVKPIGDAHTIYVDEAGVIHGWADKRRSLDAGAVAPRE